MLDNTTVLETATKFFERYRMPDGVWAISGFNDEVEITYRLGTWDVPEMEMIRHALNAWMNSSAAHHYTVEKRVEVDGVPVKVFALIPKEAYNE